MRAKTKIRNPSRLTNQYYGVKGQTMAKQSRSFSCSNNFSPVCPRRFFNQIAGFNLS